MSERIVSILAEGFGKIMVASIKVTIPLTVIVFFSGYGHCHVYGYGAVCQSTGIEANRQILYMDFSRNTVTCTVVSCLLRIAKTGNCNGGFSVCGYGFFIE